MPVLVSVPGYIDGRAAVPRGTLTLLPSVMLPVALFTELFATPPNTPALLNWI
jgi:hypothetical protein